MIGRTLAGFAWVVVAYLTLTFGIELVFMGLESVGLTLQATGLTAVSAASTVLRLVTVISVGVLAYRGRLPGTGSGRIREPLVKGQKTEIPEPSVHGQKTRLGVLPAVGLALATGAISAIVSAAVATAYSSDIYERRVQAADIDGILTVQSEVLREGRDLRVRLPSDYMVDPDRRYPVLLVLDGGWQQGHTVTTAEVLKRLDLAESMIVVGVISGPAGRNADFVPPGFSVGGAEGRADRFLEFLASEALPEIDHSFRTNSTRLLVGHSLGGLFVTYSLIERPDLFVGRFAFSPSWWVGGQRILADLQTFLADSPDLDSFFYASLGERESGGMRAAFDRGVAALTEDAPEGLRWMSEITAEADHGTNPGRSTPSALRAFWSSQDTTSNRVDP